MSDIGVESLHTNVGIFSTSVELLHTNAEGLSTSVGILHTNVEGLHTDVGKLSTGVGSLHTGVERLCTNTKKPQTTAIFHAAKVMPQVDNRVALERNAVLYFFIRKAEENRVWK